MAERDQRKHVVVYAETAENIMGRLMNINVYDWCWWEFFSYKYSYKKIQKDNQFQTIRDFLAKGESTINSETDK